MLASTPIVHLPGCSTPASVTPSDHCPAPVARCVAVGSTNAGPKPHIRGPCSTGEKKSAGLMSPSPDEPPPVLLTSGWYMIGTIVRVISIHSGDSFTGITGWMLSVLLARS